MSMSDAGDVVVDSAVADAGMVTPGCTDPFLGGEPLSVADFVGEGVRPFHTALNVGWDGRLYTDLSVLTPDNLTIPNANFYIRTRYPDLLAAPDPWVIRVRGLADSVDIELPDLLPMVRPMGSHVLECSGNFRSAGFGLLSAAEWSGVPLTEVLDSLSIDAEATRVMVSGVDTHSVPSAGGHSSPGASWVFTFDQLASAGAFLATQMNGAPLPPDHGMPVRLFVPGWFGCSNIKWVDEITLVDETEPATSQMQEFASRTHQSGVPALARDYIPATLDQTAMPTRIEKWRVDGEIVYRVVGILWGGDTPTDQVSIRFGNGPYEPVDVCPPQETNQTWTLWEHAWRPTTTGVFGIRLRVDDPSIRTRRLDSGYYLREIEIDEVAG